MKRILLALVLVFMVVPTAAAKSGASITAPDGLSFGDTLNSSDIVFTPPNHYEGLLWGEIRCITPTNNLATGWLSFESDVQSSVVLDSPTSWPSGPADCTITLWSLYGIPPGNKSYAVDDFYVSG